MLNLVVFCVVVVAAFGRHLGQDRVYIRESGPSGEANPPRINIHLDHPESGLRSLILTRRDDLNVADAPTFTVGSDGKVKRLATRSLDVVPYLDVESGAAFLVKSERRSDGIHKRSLSGILADGEYDLHLQPADDTSSRKRDVDGVVEHVMVRKRAERRDIDNGTLIVHKRSDNDAVAPIIHKRFIEKRDTESPVVYTVELLLVVDYQRYKRFTSVKEARKYYAHVIVGMELRFANLKSDFKIAVKLVGLVFLDTPEKSSLTVGQVSGRTLDAGQAIVDFEKWRDTKLKDLVNHDHAMLMTGFDIQIGGSSTLLGLALGGTICSKDSGPVSITEDLGLSCIPTAVHELAHNLGAVEHDGEGGSKGCSKAEMFIMAPSSGTTSANNRKNPFNWSSCSVKQIKAKLAALNSKGNNCLKNAAASVAKVVSKPPGQIWGPDVQCAEIFGKGAQYIGGMGEPEKALCHSLRCHVPTQPNGWMSTGSPLRGTTCGNKKWCFENECVYSAEAPAARDECIFHDSAQKILFPDGPTSCAEIMAPGPMSCYDGVIFRYCCKSCLDKKDASKPDCPYGDRQKGCSNSGYNCNSADYKKACCKTCDGVQQTSCSDQPYMRFVLQNGEFGTCTQLVAESPHACGSELIMKYCCGTCTKLNG